MKNLLFTTLLFFTYSSSFGQKVTIHFYNIRNNTGQIQLSIFENEKQFKDEKPTKSVNYEKKTMKDGKMSITYTMKSGTYAMTFLDDEDKNNSMTYKLGFYPKEGVGFSNFQLKGMSKPKFNDFSFEVKDDIEIKVTFKYF